MTRKRRHDGNAVERPLQPLNRPRRAANRRQNNQISFGSIWFKLIFGPKYLEKDEKANGSLLFVLDPQDLVFLSTANTRLSDNSVFNLLYIFVGGFNTNRPKRDRVCLMHPRFVDLFRDAKQEEDKVRVKDKHAFFFNSVIRRFLVPILRDDHFFLIEIGYPDRENDRVIAKVMDSVFNPAIMQDKEIAKVAQFLFSYSGRVKTLRATNADIQSQELNDCGVHTIFNGRASLMTEKMTPDFESMRNSELQSKFEILTVRSELTETFEKAMEEANNLKDYETMLPRSEDDIVRGESIYAAKRRLVNERRNNVRNRARFENRVVIRKEKETTEKENEKKENEDITDNDDRQEEEAQNNDIEYEEEVDVEKNENRFDENDYVEVIESDDEQEGNDSDDNDRNKQSGYHLTEREREKDCKRYWEEDMRRDVNAPRVRKPKSNVHFNVKLNITIPIFIDNYDVKKESFAMFDNAKNGTAIRILVDEFVPEEFFVDSSIENPQVSRGSLSGRFWYPRPTMFVDADLNQWKAWKNGTMPNPLINYAKARPMIEKFEKLGLYETNDDKPEYDTFFELETDRLRQEMARDIWRPVTKNDVSSGVIKDVLLLTDWRLVRLKPETMKNVFVKFVPTSSNKTKYKLFESMLKWFKSLLEDPKVEIRTIMFAFGSSSNPSYTATKNFYRALMQLTKKAIHVHWFAYDYMDAPVNPVRWDYDWKELEQCNARIENDINEIRSKHGRNYHFTNIRKQYRVPYSFEVVSDEENAAIRPFYTAFLSHVTKHCNVYLRNAVQRVEEDE